jgi:PIN domain nuclease of toxin-antitoxin system
MKLLLDTHTFLWLVEGSPSLSSAARAALADTANDLFLSAASGWQGLRTLFISVNLR